MKVIVGLGNPGAEYAQTRHNLGWRAVESFIRRHGAGRSDRRYSAYVNEATFKGEPVLLVRPRTLMNRSGKSVLGAVSATGVAPEQLMVVADDIHLAAGRLRVRSSGSSGGHNGLASIIEALGGDGWPRIRIGVGEPPTGADQSDYVLSGAGSPEEKKALDEAVERAVDALETWLKEGIEVCMSMVNSGRVIS